MSDIETAARLAAIKVHGAIQREAIDSVIKLLKQHVPSITDEIEDELNERVSRAAISYDPNDGDSADCALRVCHCGERIDGFYEYVEHLESVFSG